MSGGENYSKPDISFLIPVFNMADTLAKTLESLSAIRSFPAEIIVIDDGSSDDLEDVLVEWIGEFRSIPNIRFSSIHQLNQGRASALNEGAKLASASYISFVDADDVIDPFELEKIWNCMKSETADLILGQFKVVAECGKEISQRSLNSDCTKEDLIQRLMYYPLSPVHLNAFLIRREYFLEIGGMDKEIRKGQDKDAVIRLLRDTDSLYVCDSTHYLYKKHSLPRKKLVQKRVEWLYYRQKMIHKNFSGFPKYSSMFLQGTYDTAKLFYEGVFKYRA